MIFYHIYIFYQALIRMDPQKKGHGYVCIIGNDGTGKSTMCELLTQNSNLIGIERSMKNSENETIKKLVQEIKKIDKLTYSYSFEDDWYNFSISHQVEENGEKVRVYWVLLSAPTSVLKQRINARTEITVFQHQKCIEYFNTVYEEMAYFYGMNIVRADQPKQKVLQDIIRIISPQTNIYLPIKDITLQILVKHDLEHQIKNILEDQQAERIYDQKVLMELEASGMNKFYFPGLYDVANIETKKILAARWIKNNTSRQLKDNHIIFSYNWIGSPQNSQTVQVQLKNGYLLQRIIEGQSKILYKLIASDSSLHELFKDKVIILLKSTVYSHTKQHTGEISELGKIRAKGSMVFLEMLKRNHIKHSYISVNKEGIILSRFIQVNNYEVVFKKQCLGTDKASYFGIRANQKICQKGVCYKGGIYIRFDWRNPNHQLLSSPQLLINLDPYYYIVEKIEGKQQFFKKYLGTNRCKPIGDKCVTEDLINYEIDAKKIKQKVIETYCTFQYYAHEVGLQILDGCMMIDSEGKYIWSEINPDCLRVKSIKQREDYDKDIWRVGGSSSKQLITKKWTLFNSIFVEYFQKHRFMDTQMANQLLCKQLFAKQILSHGEIRPQYKSFYRNIQRGNRQRQVIGTIDIINGQPILVQSSVFKQKHSQGKIQQALQYISILPQILIVDIDGASDKQTNNKELIESLKAHSLINFYAVGGGIRSTQIALSYLSYFEHIVISSNLDIINEIPKEQRHKIIVQLSINEKNEVLTHARTVNTGANVIKKMVELCQLGISKISITFNNSEGKLKGVPRQQLRNIMHEVPGPIKKVIIAGGISTIDDMEFIWGFSKCVPQLGSAIWKRKIHIGDIYKKMVRFDENDLVPAVIQDKFKKNLGLIYLNDQALSKTCQERLLYRYSRQHGRVMMKGEQSGNTQKILSINIDCDNDSLLITVDTHHPIFCHLNTESCFYQQISKSKRLNLEQLQEHIMKTKNGGGTGYTYKMQNNPKLAMSKVLQQADQLSVAQNKERKMEECADLFAHLLMFMNSKDIKTEDVLTVLNKRSRQVRKAKTLENKNDIIEKIVRIGLGTGKHNKFIFDFVEAEIGIKIISPLEGKQRNYSMNFEIINQEKFKSSLKLNGDEKIILISVKPKDLVKLMEKKYIKFGVNYSNVVTNGIDKFNCLAQQKVQGLKLVLIKRKGENIDIKSWTPQQKGLIISQYPANVVNYFQSKNIVSSCYTLVKVSGHSQGFLYDHQFQYCDAIVNSGRTIKDNDLQIEAVLEDEIKVILYSLQ